MKYFAYYYLLFIFLLENVELKSKDKKFQSLKESLVFPVFVFLGFELCLLLGPVCECRVTGAGLVDGIFIQ